MTRREEPVVSKWNAAVAWANFGLVVAAVLKFVPILLSFSHGIDLTAEQVESGLATDRAWAVDLISDTPWVSDIIHNVLRLNTPEKIRLVRGSHIVQVGMVLIPPAGEVPQLSPIARLGLG